MDILGPLHKTRRGHTFILVITDRFSKLTRAIAMRSTTAANIVYVFLGN